VAALKLMEYSQPAGRLPHRQRGVALAMVVWFIAAMSVLVMGTVYESRTDVRLAQVHLGRAKAIAAGDGATRLHLAALIERRRGQGNNPGGMPLAADYRQGDTAVRVSVVPAGILVDVFAGPAEAIAGVLADGAGLAAADAQKLADNVVKWRAALPGGGRFARRMEVQEDLLRIPGFDRALLDAIRDDIRAMPGGRTAPVGSRDVDLQSLLASETLLRVDALVDYNGRQWLRRHWVSLQGGGAGSVLPWQVLRTEPPRVVGMTYPKAGT
tara:strand:+ start:487 stop:1293 length:807 start_codon:yes stop_codon:yes gene_type:complete